MGLVRFLTLPTLSRMVIHNHFVIAVAAVAAVVAVVVVVVVAVLEEPC